MAVLTNDDDVGPLFMEIIKFRLIDVALGLEKIDWSARFGIHVFAFCLYFLKNHTHRLKALISSSSSPPPPPEHPANASLPQVKYESLVGKYNNAGYGSFELCLVFPPNPNASKACKDLAACAPTILPGILDPNIPTFLSEWNATAISHASLTHLNGNIFNVRGLNSYVS